MTQPRHPSAAAGNRSGGGIVTGAGDRAGGVPSVGLRAVRRRWASGVAVVTTADAGGYRGTTVSALSPVSLEPPRLLVCLERAGRMAELIPETGIFAVSILDRAQEFLAERFAGRAPVPDPHLTGVPHTVVANGCPVLDGALAWAACRVVAVHDGGDHLIVVGEVVESWSGADTDDPLLTYEGRYRSIEGG